MNSFVEKFNIFDLFTTLIPGIIISALFGISLYSKYDSLWLSLGNEKYVIFFIFSYFCGIIFQEFGTIADHIFLYKILYGGNPREVFLSPNKYKKFFEFYLSYDNALKVRDYFINYFNISDANCLDQKKLNSFIFTYCLNMSEMKNLTGKIDKMIVISEMSRSLFWGCIFTIILNIYMIFFTQHSCQFHNIEIVILFFLSSILLHRKIRYEKYRLQILFRTFFMYIKQSN